MDINEVIKMIRIHIAENHDGKQILYAKSMGVGTGIVSAVLKGRRKPNDLMLSHIGLVKVKTVEYKIAETA